MSAHASATIIYLSQFTQEYQVEFLMQYHSTFNMYVSLSLSVALCCYLLMRLHYLHRLRENGYLNGELIWNFADFAAQSQDTRVGTLNRKGVFTRERQV
jgi:hypothetical protein